MKIRIVDKSLGMSGNNISFYDEEFFSLKPNESIIQIGNGKNNGTIRTDKFSYPIKYVGSIFIQFNKRKMFAFLLPDKVNNESIYLLYGTTGSRFLQKLYFQIKIESQEKQQHICGSSPQILSELKNKNQILI
jgi:hypothetical protein